MAQPQGFVEIGKEDLVCLLNRSLYGLKQSPRAWYEEIDSFLRLSGWQRSSSDPNLYFLRDGESITIILLFVDDLLLTSSNNQEITRVKGDLKLKYEMKELGEIKKYLGLQFKFLP